MPYSRVHANVQVDLEAKNIEFPKYLRTYLHTVGVCLVRRLAIAAHKRTKLHDDVAVPKRAMSTTIRAIHIFR